MPNFRQYNVQLTDIRSGEAVFQSGKVQVVEANGGTKRVAVYDFDTEAAASNPVAFSSGQIKFKIAESVTAVDIYGLTNEGIAFFVRNLKPSGNSDIKLNTNAINQTVIIPFDIEDTEIADATEFDTGFDLATNQAVLPTGIGVLVTEADSTETIDVGILSSESGGDADGLIDGASLGSAVYVLAGVTITTGTNTKFVAASPTKGVLLADHQAGTDVDQDEGLWSEKTYRCDGTAKSISLTLSTGTDTGAGFIIIPTIIPSALS